MYFYLFEYYNSNFYVSISLVICSFFFHLECVLLPLATGLIILATGAILL